MPVRINKAMPAAQIGKDQVLLPRGWLRLKAPGCEDFQLFIRGSVLILGRTAFLDQQDQPQISMQCFVILLLERAIGFSQSCVGPGFPNSQAQSDKLVKDVFGASYGLCKRRVGV